MNDFIIKLDEYIKQFEQKNNVILFDESRMENLNDEQKEAIDYLNFSVDPFNLHPMKILSDIVPHLEVLNDENPEKIFFYSLIENILHLYIEDRISNVSVV
jgi:hypothetical protein